MTLFPQQKSKALNKRRGILFKKNRIQSSIKEQSILLMTGIIEPPIPYIVGFGKTITEKFRSTITSTTRMATRQITESKIWNVFISPSTTHCILKLKDRLEECIQRDQDLKHSNGIDLLMEGELWVKHQKRDGRKDNLLREAA